MDIHNSQGEKLEYAVHEADRDDVIVVIGHGVTGDMDRDLIIALANGLQERGWPCVRFSFSGNGNSEGSFEEMCITKEVGDLTAVIDQMKGAGFLCIRSNLPRFSTKNQKEVVENCRLLDMAATNGTLGAMIITEPTPCARHSTPNYKTALCAMLR